MGPSLCKKNLNSFNVIFYVVRLIPMPYGMAYLSCLLGGQI